MGSNGEKVEVHGRSWMKGEYKAACGSVLSLGDGKEIKRKSGVGDRSGKAAGARGGVAAGERRRGHCRALSRVGERGERSFRRDRRIGASRDCDEGGLEQRRRDSRVGAARDA